MISELEDEDEQEFGFGGPSFIGGTVRENPVDTLSEVINLFPGISASQAADFLAEYSGISPTDALRIDPDIRNISSPDGLEDVNVSPTDLDDASRRAEELTCRLFGLNCPE